MQLYERKTLSTTILESNIISDYFNLVKKFLINQFVFSKKYSEETY